MVKAERDGEILIEVSDAVRESLIATMNREELRAAAEQLDTDEIVGNLMLTDTIQLRPEEKAEQAAQAFERYDLVSAPVVDDDNRLAGRVTVNVGSD